MAANVEVPEVTPEASTRERVVDGCRTAAHFSHEAELLKSLARDTIEEAVHAAKAGIRQKVRTLEDLTDGARTRIRRRPIATAGAAFGIGLGLGAVAMWIGRAMARRRDATHSEGTP